MCSKKEKEKKEHKHKENVEKNSSMKKEIILCTHIYIICKQKE
jgi:hypothetical protein